jgi:hypothetical protein
MFDCDTDELCMLHLEVDALKKDLEKWKQRFYAMTLLFIISAASFATYLA